MKLEKELIYDRLSELYDTYDREAPDDVPADYLVYHLDEFQMHYERNDYRLTVSCVTTVDEDGSAPDLDAMVDAVKSALYFESFTTEDLTYTFYYDGASEVEELDKNIKRVDVRFTIVGYEPVERT